MTVEAIAEFIRSEWASHGVEVQATGTRSLTLMLPPQLLGMTELCVELFDRFEAATDFKHTLQGSTITVWAPLERKRPPPPAVAGSGMVYAAAAVPLVLLLTLTAEWMFGWFELGLFDRKPVFAGNA